MKIKRQKKVNKVLSFFKHNFGHHPPYQVLLDGTFTQACLTMKVNIKEQLPKYLGDVKLLTTKCCIAECEKLGPQLFGATTILKQFPLHKCAHEEDFRPAMKCLKAMIGQENKHRYFVATQDPELREKCRKVAGTPILYLHHNAPVLEKPSGLSEVRAQDTLEERMRAEQQRIKNLKVQLGLTPESKGRKRKRGNPNPLSCLKSKKKKEEPLSNVAKTTEAEKKRKRIRSRKKKPQESIE